MQPVPECNLSTASAESLPLAQSKAFQDLQRDTFFARLRGDHKAEREARHIYLKTFEVGKDMIIATRTTPKCRASGETETRFYDLHDGAYGLKHSGGRRYFTSDNLTSPEEFSSVVIAPKEPAGVSSREAWRRIACSMVRHKINIFAAREIFRALAGEPCGRGCAESKYTGRASDTDGHTHFAGNYWNVNTTQPRRASFADCWKRLNHLRGITTLAALKSAVDKNAAEVKAAKRTYTSEGASIKGTRRDRSLYMELGNDGYHYHAASEYAGCGNGSYYLMFSETQAVYCEDD